MRFRIIAVSVVSLAVGCGGAESPRQSISGTITLDGNPVEKGVITFLPQKGEGPVVGVEFADGEYEIEAGKGPIPGEYRVEIKSPKQTDRKVVVVPGEPPGYETVETIPRQYNTRSKLVVSVEEGHNEENFDLTSSGR